MKFHLETSNVELWRIERQFQNEPHRHDDQFQLTIPIRGSFRLMADNRLHTMTSGQSLVQYPGEEHHFRLEGDAGVVIILVRRQALGSLFDGQDIQPRRRQSVAPGEICGLIGKWGREWLERACGETADPDETEWQVLDYFRRTLQGGADARQDDAVSATRLASDPDMKRAFDYINEHFTETLPVDELAALAFRSKYHFIRSFKAVAGVSPYQYVLQLRMREARRRLAGSRSNVAQISLDLGFSSPSQFYRLFVRATGLTPEQYRKKAR